MVSEGVDGNKKVVPILVDSSGRPYIILDDGSGNTMPSGDALARPVFTTPGTQSCFHVHLCKRGIGADTGLMLIDLSDTANWPHTLTGSISLYNIAISIAGSKLTAAEVALGYLSNVDATDGDFTPIHCWMVGFPGTNEPMLINEVIDYSWRGFQSAAAARFAPTSANNALFQTDVNLFGPDGNTAYPSGNGDLVMFIDWTAGELDVSISIDYETFA